MMLRSRLLSLRAYNEMGVMVAADVVDGEKLEKSIVDIFQEDEASYVHIHNAKPSCYSCRARRLPA